MSNKNKEFVEVTYNDFSEDIEFYEEMTEEELNLLPDWV